MSRVIVEIRTEVSNSVYVYLKKNGIQCFLHSTGGRHRTRIKLEEREETNGIDTDAAIDFFLSNDVD